MEWLLLAGAIVFEVFATTCMKISHGLSKLVPSILVFIGYSICFVCLALSLKKLPVSVAYAIWSGVGTAIIAMIGVLYFKESWSLIKMGSILLIIIGIVGLQFSSQH